MSLSHGIPFEFSEKPLKATASVSDVRADGRDLSPELDEPFHPMTDHTRRMVNPVLGTSLEKGE